MLKRPFFDRVIVMDPVALTGHALCLMADRAGIATHPGVYVRDGETLRGALALHGGEQLLVITELMSQQDTLAGGLNRLSLLGRMQSAGRLRVMVCTGLDDPLLLKMVTDRRPATVCLRRESLAVLRRSMRDAQCIRKTVSLSPAVHRHMQSEPFMCAAPRELEWLVTQVDGMSLHESAMAMFVCDKTAYTWRYRFIRRYGGKHAFIRYLAGLQRRVFSLTKGLT